MNTYHMSREKRIKENKITYKHFIEQINTLDSNQKQHSNFMHQNKKPSLSQRYSKQNINNIGNSNSSFIIREHQDGKLYTFCDSKQPDSSQIITQKIDLNNQSLKKREKQFMNKQNFKNSLNKSTGTLNGFEGKYLKTEQAQSQKKYFQNTNKLMNQAMNNLENKSCKKIQKVRKAYICIKSRSNSKNSKQNRLEGSVASSVRSSAQKNTVIQSQRKNKIVLNIGNIKKSAQLSIRPCRSKLSLDDKNIKDSLLNNNSKQGKQLILSECQLNKFTSMFAKQQIQKDSQLQKMRQTIQNCKQTQSKVNLQSMKSTSQMKNLSKQNEFLKKDCFRLALVIQELKDKDQNLISQNQDFQSIIVEVKRQNSDLKECLAFKKKEVDHLKQDLNRYIQINQELRSRQQNFKKQSIQNIGYYVKQKLQKYQIQLQQLRSQNEKLFLIKEKLQNYNQNLKGQIIQKDEVISQYYKTKKSSSLNQSLNYSNSSRIGNCRQEKLIGLIQELQNKLKLSNINNQYLTNQISICKHIINQKDSEFCEETNELTFNKTQRTTKQFTHCQENKTRHSDPFSIFTNQNQTATVQNQI